MTRNAIETWLVALAPLLPALSVGCNNDAAKPAESTAPATDAPSAAPSAAAPGAAKPDESTTGPIKVGILHSLSGTMAISETSLKDVALMTIGEINAKGGVLGRKLEAVVIDPAPNWPLFAEKARELLQKDKVSVVFGCWTSVSRKSVLPVFEELNGLLFYPVQYEGEESSYNVFYTGAAPNQQAIPAVEYLMSEKGGGAKRFELLGTDYVYPRPQRLPDDRGEHQEVRGRQAHGGHLDDQRRFERPFLQGARQPGSQGA